MSHKKIQTILLLTIFSCLMVVGPLCVGESTPIEGPLIVALSNDYAARRSIRLLTENINDSRVVYIQNPTELNLVLRKAVGDVFYVGHGTEVGIETPTGEIPWEQLVTWIQASPARQHYLLACNSEEAAHAQYGPSKLVLGFSGAVESELGALTALAYYYCILGQNAKYIHFAVQLMIQAWTQTERCYLGKATYRGIIFRTLTWDIKYEHPSCEPGDNTPNGIGYWDDTVLLGDSNGAALSAQHLSLTTVSNIRNQGSNQATMAAVMAGLFAIICGSISAYDPELISRTIAGIIAVIAFIVAAILEWFAGQWVQYVDMRICDETGCGWFFQRDFYIAPQWVLGQVGWDFYTKWGCDQWFHTNYVCGWVQVTLPTGLGYEYIRSSDDPLVPNPPPPGGGGCPILSVYDGTQYVSEGLLDIHAFADVIRWHQLTTTPAPVNHQYNLRLTEHPQTISHIDTVRLIAVLEDGRLHALPLVSAMHSTQGNVLRELLSSDDVRVTELGADHNNGASEYIDLQFVAPPSLRIVGYWFVIEGYNRIIK